MSQDNCQDNNQRSSQPNSDAQLTNDIIHRWRNKQSIRSIARELGLNRFKVASIIRAHQLSTELPAADDPSAAEATPPSLGPAPVLRGSKLDRFEEQLKQLLQRYPRITAKRVYEELQRLGYEGGYSILRVRVKQLRARPAKPLTIRFETAPGVQAQMDWSTYEIDFTQEGKRRVQLFSYILSYSRRQYIHFTDRQDFETTTRQHIAAFEHLGGVATTCLYDNMKVVVTRWEDGQPVYNTRFLAFATHYGYRPWACQVYRPQTKGKVERPFHYIETNLLNGREFRSLDHLHEVARWWLAEVADTRVHGTTKKTPLELHAEELPHLLPLPALRFDTAQVVYRIADTDGTIQYANNRYSVPWQLMGEQLPVRITETELLVYNRSLSLVAKHVLFLGGTSQSHLDPLHAPPKDVEQQRSTLRERYAELGPVGSQFLEGLLAKQRYGKHDAQRVLSLLHAYSLKDILAAMSRAIQYHAYGYQSLERILAHFGTPKPSWEVLSDKEQDALKRLTQSDPIGPRRSEDYQHLLKNQPDHDQDQPNQPEQQEPEQQHLPFNDQPSGENPQAPDDAQDPDVSGNA